MEIKRKLGFKRKENTMKIEPLTSVFPSKGDATTYTVMLTRTAYKLSISSFMFLPLGNVQHIQICINYFTDWI